MTKNNQSTGDNSHAIVAGGNVTITNGLTVADVKEIFHDLMKDYLGQMQNVAAEVAEQRVENFSKSFLDAAEQRFGEQIEEKLSKLADPNLQYVFREAQLGYCRQGDEKKKKLLVEMMLKKVEGGSSEYETIISDQAILVMDRLTNPQINYLAFMVWAAASKREVLNPGAFDELVRNTVNYASTFSFSRGEISFLASAGCLSPHGGITHFLALDEIWSKFYPVFFAKGGTRSEFGIKKPLSLNWVPTHFDSSREVPAYLAPSDYRDALARAGEPVNQVNQLVQLFEQNLMNGEERTQALKSKYPELEPILEKWTEQIRSFRLTPTGMMIGLVKLETDGFPTPHGRVLMLNS